MSRYSEMTEEERTNHKERVRNYNAEHVEEHKKWQRKYMAEHREEWNEYKRKWRHENRELRRDRLDMTGGTKKGYIRTQSRRYLLRRHSSLDGYEIHHCFGYDDHRKFIYIPKTLHLQIHQLLRDNNISADSDHWMAIRDLVNSCEEYTYISV